MSATRLFTRRGILAVSAALPTLAAFFTARTAGAQEHGAHAGHDPHAGHSAKPAKKGAASNGGGHAGHGAGHAAGHAEMDPADMYPAHAWADPAIRRSKPPATMNRKMGSVHAPDLPPMGWEMDGDVKVFHLTIQPVERLFVDGAPPPGSLWDTMHRAKGVMHAHNLPKKVRAWGINGVTPGPVIEAVEGDRVRIHVKNELPEATTIHWHGLEIPNEQDGVGGLTQPPIQPGKSWTYEFTLIQNGCFMYHSSFNEKKQVGLGVGGMFVIHPKTPERKIDRDFSLMLNEWKLLPGSPYIDVTSTEPNWFTFNGKSAPSTEIMECEVGDVVRIRFANLSNHNSHPIHLHGVTWQVVGTEGGPIPPSARWPGNTVDVPPGGVREVEFVPKFPGPWHFHCHKLHHIVNAHVDMPMGVMPMGGMTSILVVKPKGEGPKGGSHDPHAGHAGHGAPAPKPTPAPADPHAGHGS